MTIRKFREWYLRRQVRTAHESIRAKMNIALDYMNISITEFAAFQANRSERELCKDMELKLCEFRAAFEKLIDEYEASLLKKQQLAASSAIALDKNDTADAISSYAA